MPSLGTEILPGESPMPCPALLTESEAVRYLRLDVDGPKQPTKTLRYYREKGQLYGIKVGRHLRYRRIDLDEFLASLSKRAAKRNG